MSVELPERITGLPQAPRLSQERAKVLVREQREQMARDVKKRREELENPTFWTIKKHKGLLSALRWSLSI